MIGDWLSNEIESVCAGIGGGTGLLLAGPMCAGKSTLADELQGRLTTAYLVYDHCYDHAARRYDASKRGITLAHDRSLRLGHALAIRGLLLAGVNVISTLGYWEGWGRRVVREAYGQLNVFVIRLHCTLETAVVREQRRALEQGLSADNARLAWESLHESHLEDWVFPADLAVDTELGGPEASAGGIVEWLRSEPRPTALKLLQPNDG